MAYNDINREEIEMAAERARKPENLPIWLI
jgi:hypothetical protein